MSRPCRDNFGDVAADGPPVTREPVTLLPGAAAKMHAVAPRLRPPGASVANQRNPGIATPVSQTTASTQQPDHSSLPYRRTPTPGPSLPETRSRQRCDALPPTTHVRWLTGDKG